MNSDTKAYEQLQFNIQLNGRSRERVRELPAELALLVIFFLSTSMIICPELIINLQAHLFGGNILNKPLNLLLRL